MKKLLLLFSALLITVLLMTACNKTPAETTPDSPETTVPESEATTPEPETSTTEPETSTPETTAPAPETTAPTPETTAPAPETTAPAPETTTPDTEHQHIAEIIPAVPATCTATGLTEGKKCTDCGEILSVQTEVPMLPHTEEIIRGKAPTCTETGTTDSTICKVCNAIIVATQPIPPNGHIFGHDAYCDICGFKLDTPLQKAKDKALANLASIQASAQKNRHDYAQEDFDAIINAIRLAEEEIESATTVEQVESALAKAQKIFNDRPTIPTRLEIYYKTVLNNITLSSSDLIAEIDTYLYGKVVDGCLIKAPIQIQYTFDYNSEGGVPDEDDPYCFRGYIPKSILEYNTGLTDENGNAITVNLIHELRDAIYAYNYLVDIVVDQAASAVYSIDRIGVIYITFDSEGLPTHSKFEVALYEYKRIVNELQGIEGMEPGQYARFLADEENLKLVTNRDILFAAEKKMTRLRDAYVNYADMMEIGRIDARYDALDLFKYENPSDTTPIPQNYRVDFTLKNAYDLINSLLNNWIKTYELEDDFVNTAILINKLKGDTWTWDGSKTSFDYDIKQDTLGDAATDFGFYGEYLWCSKKVDFIYDAFISFAYIKMKIDPLNTIMNLKSANVKAFEQLAADITAWKEAYLLDNYNFAKVIDAYDINYLEDETAFEKAFNAASDMIGKELDFVFPGGASQPIIYVNPLGINQVEPVEDIIPEHYTEEYNYVALFRFTHDRVRSCIEDDNTYFLAKSQAADLEKAISKIDTNKVNSLLPLVKLDGLYRIYEEKGYEWESTWSMRTAEEVHALNAPDTYIQSWYATWVTSEYDFSPLFNQALFDNAWTAIEDRIASMKTDYADKILTLISDENGVLIDPDSLAFAHKENVLTATTLYIEGIKSHKLTALREMMRDKQDMRFITFPLILSKEAQNTLESAMAKIDEIEAITSIYSRISDWVGDWGYKSGEMRSILTLNEIPTKIIDGVEYGLDADGNRVAGGGLSTLELLQAAEAKYLAFMEANNYETTSAKAKALIAARESFRVHNYMALSLLVRNAWYEANGNEDHLYMYIILDYVQEYETTDLKTLLNQLNMAISEAYIHDHRGWSIPAISLVEGSEFQTLSSEAALETYYGVK